jgi:hypothetical protein
VRTGLDAGSFVIAAVTLPDHQSFPAVAWMWQLRWVDLVSAMALSTASAQRPMIGELRISRRTGAMKIQPSLPLYSRCTGVQDASTNDAAEIEM